jgi:hypothetical protein
MIFDTDIYFKDKNNEKILFEAYSGSLLYGTNTPGKSDIDIKGVFLPNITDLILNKAPKKLYFKGIKHPKRRIAEQIIRQTIPIDVIKKQIFEKWQDQITIYEETYVSSSVKAKFNDKTYGDFYSIPNRVINGMTYYKIANKKRGVKERKYNVEYISKKLVEKFGDEVVLDINNFEYGKKHGLFIKNLVDGMPELIMFYADILIH